MTDRERAAHVEALFAELSGASPAERDAALHALGNPDLVAEVTRLLAAHDEVSAAGPGFPGGIHARPVRALIDAPAPAARAHIGRYPVVRPLGQGGMGVVYLAHDPLLNRPVAIKLLSPHLGRSPAAVRRLTAEARLISALDHPNIAAVHEIGETDDGQSFIVMGYYQGETLREHLGRGRLGVDEVLDIGIQLADGLGAAHRAGITHHDIKPENVVLTSEGRAVILDFGIARGAADLVTGGPMRGTVAYMSPEQSRGEDTDPRTDVWSTGVVLHELLTGARPFPGDDRALVHAIREGPPAPLAPGLPPALAEVIKSCLAKSPALRLRSGGELAAALRAIRDGRAPVMPRKRRRAALAAVTLVALAATALYLRSARQPGLATLSGAVTSAAPGIAVLPFDVRGDEHQIWREGMVDVLSVNLDGVEGLRGIDSRTVLAHWARRSDGGPGTSLASALEVAREAGAQYAVLGSIVPLGHELRIAVRVYSVSGEPALASFGMDGPADSLLSLVDQVTIKVLAATSWQGRPPTAAVNLGRITTRSLPALKSFLNGERLLRKADYAAAATHYRDAITADSGFAFAHYRLGMAQVWVGEGANPSPTWQRALQDAVRLSDRLPGRERLLLQLALAVNAPSTQTSRATLELARLAVARYPDEADAWFFLGDTYYHQGDQLLAPPEAADSAFQQALALDPAMVMLSEHLVENAINASFDSARARRLLDGYARSSAPDRVQRLELAFAFAFGDSASQQQALVLFGTLPEGERVATTGSLRDIRYASVLTHALGDYGHWQPGTAWFAAERLLQLAIDRGETEQALRHLAAPQLVPGHQALNAYRAWLGRLPLPDSVVRAALAMPPAGAEQQAPGAGYQVAVASAAAAMDGRWDEHEAGLERLGVMAQVARDRADTATARFVGGSRTALRGFGLGLRGDRSRALDSLMAGQEASTGGESIAGDAWNALVRWWIGDLLEQNGRLADAARYFSSIRRDPFAAERVAPIYEQLGQPDRARTSYLLVAEAWRDGDPIMQQRAAAAHEAARRLAPNVHGD